jgi:hypothetical protein
MKDENTYGSTIYLEDRISNIKPFPKSKIDYFPVMVIGDEGQENVAMFTEKEVYRALHRDIRYPEDMEGVTHQMYDEGRIATAAINLVNSISLVELLQMWVFNKFSDRVSTWTEKREKV